MSEKGKIVPEEEISRRGLLIKSRSIAGAIAGGALSYMLLSMLDSEKNFLRPPGAAAKEVFNSLCIRCGKCAKICPYNALKIADVDAGLATGTPYLVAREVPCYLCPDFPCIASCPTSALNHEIKEREQVEMGTALITDRENCLSLNGLRCEVCYRVCPLIDKAITLKDFRNIRTGRHTIFEPVIHKEECVGCGQCEHKCVLEKSAIKVLPTEMISGKIGEHYMFGWK